MFTVQTQFGGSRGRPAGTHLIAVSSLFSTFSAALPVSLSAESSSFACSSLSMLEKHSSMVSWHTSIAAHTPSDTPICISASRRSRAISASPLIAVLFRSMRDLSLLKSSSASVSSEVIATSCSLVRESRYC
ncbi:MAG: hypothetical protein A4E24_02054 [Methanomethylovorans sp. PtaU1.Bin093]|nr:MAG: hypothetical protein A4E24_02054 [Methanomethylovorans sp. PtaU1.Bin093]